MYKKSILLLLTLAMLFLSLSGCNSNSTSSNTQSSKVESEADTQETKEPTPSKYVTNDYPGVQMRIVPEKTDDKIMTVEIINDTEDVIMYGQDYYFAYLKDGVWYGLSPIKPFSIEDIGYTIAAGETEEYSFAYTENYNFENYTQYRIIKDFHLDKGRYVKGPYYLSDGFEIKLTSNE